VIAEIEGVKRMRDTKELSKEILSSLFVVVPLKKRKTDIQLSKNEGKFNGSAQIPPFTPQNTLFT